MNDYIKQLESMDLQQRMSVCTAILETTHAIVDQLHGLSDNRLVLVKEESEESEWNRLMCLKWLAEGTKVIELRYLEDYNYIPIGSQGNEYLISIINRYAFEELMLALMKIEARDTNYDGYDKSIVDEKLDNLVYYDTTSGRGIVNGKNVFLRGRNRRLFNALFLSAPNPVNKSSLLTIAKSQKKYTDESNIYVVNDAFSLVRKACKVDSSVISLKGNSGRLDAKVFPLSFQFPQKDFRAPK